MDSTAEACAGFDEVIVFLRYFTDLTDPLQRGKVFHSLEDVAWEIRTAR